MTVPAETKKRYTIEEYLTLERAAVEKHEFHDGEILAMSGTSVKHSLINANLIGSVRNRLSGKPCRIFDSNLRVRIVETNRYLYPDASIICGKPAMDPADGKLETVTNPRVIFEVLSSSTEGYDRGDKFQSYRTIPSLEEYVLISQLSAVVETYHRQKDGRWLFSSYQGIESKMRLSTMESDVQLAEIYDGVEFPSPSASNPST